MSLYASASFGSILIASLYLLNSGCKFSPTFSKLLWMFFNSEWISCEIPLDFSLWNLLITASICLPISQNNTILLFNFTVKIALAFSTASFDCKANKFKTGSFSILDSFCACQNFST
ncbi:unnamed protein product [Blepharisma stoltei]|uniref:Uncharacterized protein n=1 Tax=Blepharisma stoltei TaxID=1481888 RepID=A0AAU9IZN0_9CILI|nr:unnamed protein product [Blepharisma stoltei]